MFITIQRFVVNNLNQHAEMQQEIACTNVRLHIIIYTSYTSTLLWVKYNIIYLNNLTCFGLQ